MEVTLRAFAAIDSVLAAWLHAVPRLILWGMVMGALSMALYKLLSPKQKLAEVKARGAKARQQMATFDGEFDQLMPLVRESLSASCKQIGLALGPALVASLPLLACAVWLNNAFGPSELHTVGPLWVHGWEAPFFVALLVTSVAIKVAFKID